MAVGLADPTSQFHLCVVDGGSVGTAQREVIGASAPKLLDASFTIGRGLI
jgi:hypothetical protein